MTADPAGLLARRLVSEISCVIDNMAGRRLLDLLGGGK